MKISKKILTPAVEAIASSILANVAQRERYTLDSYYEMLSHPVVAAYAELRVLLGLTFIQSYTHTDPAIADEVSASSAALDGSWLGAIARALNFINYGFSFTERSFNTSSGKAVLAQMRTLDPRRLSFRGSQGEIKDVEYRSTLNNIYIPYKEGIHLVNQEYFLIDNTPYGYASARRAVPYYEAYKIATACYLVACQRQATPITVGKTDITAEVNKIDSSGTVLLDQFGNPLKVNQGAAMLARMEELENASGMVIGREDDLFAIAQDASPAMFDACLKFFERMIALSWLVPETTLGSNLSGTGDSGLSAGHNQILGMVTRAVMENVGDRLIENIVKPMLIFNYGEMDDYGHFPIDDGRSEDAAAMLGAIAKVVDGAPLDSKDQGVIDRVKKLAGMA